MKNFIRNNLTEATMTKEAVVEQINLFFDELSTDELYSAFHGVKPGASEEERSGHGFLSRLLVTTTL